MHEALHLYGFASQTDIDGQPANGFYTEWDEILKSTSNYQANGNSQNLNFVLPHADCNINALSLNSNTFPTTPNYYNSVRNQCNSSDLDIVVGDGIAPISGDQNLPIDPNSASTDDFLNAESHLNSTCNGQNVDYVMQPNILTCVERRVITPDEMNILCELGYKTNTCNGCFVTSENHGFHEGNCCNKFYFSCINENLVIPFADLLCKDFTKNNSSLSITNI